MIIHAPTSETRVLDEFRDRLAWARLRLARTAAVTDDDLETLAAHESRAIAEDPSTGTVGELLSRLHGEARCELGEIDAAQARLEAGAFGRCEDCRQQIPLARLRARPTARRCGPCERAAESRAAEGNTA